MKHFVIGYGEVGRALVQLLGCDWSDVDSESIRGGKPDVLHVCVPWSEKFRGIIHTYEARFQFPEHVVVHSTVPVGTCDSLGWIHSPVRGVHPHLYEGLCTFIKYFGGIGAELVTPEFRTRGVPCRVLPDARTCEALKLWETTQYGAHIRLMQEIHRYCEENRLSFDDVYRDANRTYNRGYELLGRRNVVRPVLNYSGPDIGGHCVLPNAELLGGPVAALVREGFKK